MQTYKIPTGALFVDDYERGKLETLSIGDYGKAFNVKANFLGYTKPINGVPNGACMPLSEKWVITVSTQYGCPMKCTFCDVPNIKFNGNASVDDLKQQLYSAIKMYPDVKYTERLNLHFARMGEPMFNENVHSFAEWLGSTGKRQIQEDLGLRIEVIHPVLTTSLPKSLKTLADRLLRWTAIKNDLYNGQAGLQISVNSTDEAQRNAMFGNMSLSLQEFAKIAKTFPAPIGRKYCLNIAYASGNIVDASVLKDLFDPDHWMVKITPIHNNTACKTNGIVTLDGYSSYTPYATVENDLISAGFDVLVFVPSFDEENGLVTCGNAVLGGSTSDIVKP